MRRNRGEYMKNLKKLTILHSNDMHGDFLAEQIDERLVGGVSLLSGYVNKVRREEKNVIYAIAGDMFRGSVIDSEYKGTSTIGIMNLMGPDVATIGNHEVDYGLAHLLFLEKCADFPIINANLHIKSNGRRMFRPFWIAHIDGMKILFIGIITEEVLAATKNTAFMYMEEGIRCNALSPGGVVTDIPLVMPPADEFGFGRTSKLLDFSGELAMPEDLADAILFLASDQSRYVNGEELKCDGGWTCF